VVVVVVAVAVEVLEAQKRLHHYQLYLPLAATMAMEGTSTMGLASLLMWKLSLEIAVKLE
jgi:hypothetical protein